MNFDRVILTDGDDVHHHLSSNAQLHSLETYINADVNHALSFKKAHVEIVGHQNAGSFPEASDGFEMFSGGEGSLGVALIQPVTAGLEISESRRDLYPTRRSIFVNVEPVSTMLSFEDLNLIETVVGRLTESRSKQKGKHASASPEKSGFQSSRPAPGFDRATRKDGLFVYDIVFETQRLGLGLKTVEGRTIVNTIENKEYDGLINVGDVLLSISSSDCSGCTLNEIVRRLSSSARPVTLQFGSSICSSSEGSGEGMTVTTTTDNPPRTGEGDRKEVSFSVASVIVEMRKGFPSGLQLERSICGALPVVSKVFPEFADAATKSTVGVAGLGGTEETLAPEIHFPRAGAIIAAIDGIPLADIGLEEAWKILNATLSSDENCDVPDRYSADEVYALTFLEIDAKLWGVVESVNISSSGFTLSFIDDLNGRDMPLFRGRLEALELRAERGIGGRSQIIEVQVPSLVKILNIGSSTTSSTVVMATEQLDQVRSESVVSLSAVVTCSMDYFHPKVAFWEPLIETSQLFLMLEKQSWDASAGRAGQVAIEVSDRLLRDQDFRSGSLSSTGDVPKMVAFNLTDAAVEVAVQAAGQWKAWRESKIFSFDEDGEVEMELEEELDDVTAPRDHGSAAPLGSPSRPLKLDEDSDPGGSTYQKQQRSNAPRDKKRIAAQRAAQAALVFAKKRGAERSKKSDSAKPFVLRNRTGVSIAFVQQDVRVDAKSSPAFTSTYPSISVVGEYQGLDGYSSSMVHELADKEDARFSMEVFSNRPESDRRDNGSSVRSASNKVRSYEGRFPSLTVAIQAVAGITIQPLKDLQVFKVGSTVRHLLVQKENRDGCSHQEDVIEYSIPVVWKVEILDNRRVLTLSTAVRVVTTAFNAEMEIGVQPIVFDNTVEKSLTSRSEMTAVGTVRQDCPFYLPLWVALKLEAVNVFVRPLRHGSICAPYGWGGSSILRFAPLNVDPGQERWTWVWEETFEELDTIRCDALDENGHSLWLAVFSGSSSDSPGFGQYIGTSRRGSSSRKVYEGEHSEVISVTLDANVTLRNMLPMRVDWQIAQRSYGTPDVDIVDGSSYRPEETNGGTDGGRVEGKGLNSGECTEAFSCDFQSSTLLARFKELSGRNWSDWALLSLDVSDEFEETTVDGDEDSQAIFPRARQVNVQVSNDSFGVPMTFGVRVLPKLTFGQSGDASKAQTYGVEIILYAELWIRNITSLPMNFGCPSTQVHGNKATNQAMSENAIRFNAESALMEIASVLEVGDKGTGFDRHGTKGDAYASFIESLPNQQCDELWEEVFEYLEIEYSTVKRRWWASDSYDSFRANITQSSDSEDGHWRWISENWVSRFRLP